MPDATTRILLRSAVQLFDSSKRLAKFAEETLTEARRRTQSSLVAMGESHLDESVSIQHQRLLLNEIDLHLNAAKKSIENRFRQEWTDVYQLRFTDFIQEIALFEKTRPVGYTAEQLTRFSKLTPRVSSNLIKATLDGSLNQLSESILHLREPIRKILAVNIIEGGSYSSIIRDIASTGISGGPFKSAHHRARAIAITETTNIHNTASYEAINSVNRILPEKERLQFKWMAILDGKTSSRCRSLHGQVRPQGKNFEASDGWKGKKPAAHPHCRSQLIAYRPEWDDIFKDLETALKRR
jgi:SPP1 gp7 family putative phage head morphogenesis protein